MFGGGLMQLVAYGAQDVYLNGNPEITFFNQVYRKHTNFSMEHVELPDYFKQERIELRYLLRLIQLQTYQLKFRDRLIEKQEQDIRAIVVDRIIE